MGIVSIYTDTAGQVGVNPRRVKILTTDGLSAITTAGYLNTEVLSSYTIYPTDLFDIVYSYSIQTNSGTYGEFIVTFSAGVSTLHLIGPSGGVIVLPTKTDHIAVFTDTLGTIGEDASTAINGGNIQAGLSGTAGALFSYPATASTGFLEVKATSNSGNFDAIITNAALGQTTTYTLPDPGGPSATFSIAVTPTVANHIAIFKNTTGVLTEDVSTAINQGNIQAGTSGHAGEFISFPGTASNGTLVLAASNNSNNFASTITNTAVDQATTYKLPDPLAATADITVVVSPTANHIAVYENTTGLLTQDVSTCFNDGDIQCGESGHPGRSISCATDGTRLIWEATECISPRTLTVTNAIVGQDCEYVLEDPGTSSPVSIVLLTSAATIGDICTFQSESGIIQDAGFAIHGATTAAWAGGGTSHAFTTTNMTSASIVTAVILTQSNAASIVTAVPGTDTLTITFSADPGANTTINWISMTAPG